MIRLSLGLSATLAAATVLACTHHPPALSAIPLATGAPWVTVFQAPGFRISADTLHVDRLPADSGALVWFVTLHDAPRTVDTVTFDRSRIRLLVRCQPLGFRSVSQDLSLGDGHPVSHIEWTWFGSSAPPWRVPDAGATDDVFLRRTCALLHEMI